MLIGAGANFGHVQLGLRYAHGLAELAASEEAEFLLGDSRNAALQLYVAFGLGSK